MPPELTRREFLGLTATAGSTLAFPNVLLPRRAGQARPGRWFGAAKPGRVPTARRPRFGSVTLPAGRAWIPEENYGPPVKRPVAWATDTPTADAFALARTLSNLFPQTGLWPLLWLNTDRPAAYCSSLPRPSRIDGSRAETILRRQWRREPPQAEWVAPLGTRFPGLAAPTTEQPERFDAFHELRAWQAASARFNPLELTPRLMLVPCTRPADAVAAMHLICGLSEGVSNPGEVSSVLRSWERRFGAVLVGAEPGGMTLAVGAPPRSFDRALRIAAEQFAFAPREDAGAPGALGQLARELLGGHPPYTWSGRRIWTFGWDD